MNKITLKTQIGKVKGLVWGKGNTEKILALHGWLDNANSFHSLAPLLSQHGYEVVAIDFPGHGKSFHRQKGHFLHVYDHILDIQSVIEALAWKKMTILGHSMGAAMSQMYVTAFPEKIQNLIMIENLGAIPAYKKGEAANTLRQALNQWESHDPKQKRRYESIDQALNARLKVTPMERDSLRPMVKRGLTKTKTGYKWRTDKRLKISSLFRLSEEAVQEFLAETKVKTLLMLAKPTSYALNYPTVEARIKALNPEQTAYIEGHHHFHMDKAEETAQQILQFLKDKQ